MNVPVPLPIKSNMGTDILLVPHGGSCEVTEFGLVLVPDPRQS